MAPALPNGYTRTTRKRASTEVTVGAYDVPGLDIQIEPRAAIWAERYMLTHHLYLNERTMYLATIFIVLLLLPPTLLLVGQRVLDRTRQDREHDDRIALLELSRRVAWICCLMPILRMLFSFAPARFWRSLGNLGIFLNLFLPLVGILAGLTAIVLFLISARGGERYLSPLACLLAASMSVFLALGGMAAA